MSQYAGMFLCGNKIVDDFLQPHSDLFSLFEKKRYHTGTKICGSFT